MSEKWFKRRRGVLYHKLVGNFNPLCERYTWADWDMEYRHLAENPPEEWCCKLCLKKSLPTIEEITGSDPDFTGELSTKQYLDEVRGKAQSK